mmetsp:Transcript_51845/g.146110  ORF Transcript_51845/g.146110 Transcript_51845/m.146110 type:complete len:548 (+) Transcript_51845:42-1685(+)
MLLSAWPRVPGARAGGRCDADDLEVQTALISSALVQPAPDHRKRSAAAAISALVAATLVLASAVLLLHWSRLRGVPLASSELGAADEEGVSLYDWKEMGRGRQYPMSHDPAKREKMSHFVRDVMLVRAFMDHAREQHNSSAAGQPGYPDDLGEWDVVFSKQVKVRKNMDMSSPILGQIDSRSIVVGKQIGGEWVKLYKEPGYVKIALRFPSNTVLLKQRTAFYLKLESGMCEDFDMFPITLADACEVAAVKLGLNSTTVTTEGTPGKAPQKCYYSDEGPSPGTLWMGDWARQGQRPLCSSQDYPVTTGWDHPSLFCWLLMLKYTSEVDLVKAQFNSRGGIFSCDEHTVYSDYRIELGRYISGILFESTPFGTTRNSSRNNEGWLLNSALFVRVWDRIIKDGRYAFHDWVVKVDPDTVFFAYRLKWHLKEMPQDELCYVSNRVDDSGPRTLLGGIEVFSSKSITRFGNRKHLCAAAWDLTGTPVQRTKEDSFMESCMDKLGVERHEDPELLHDGSPDRPPKCVGAWTVAYHPFKEPDVWLDCVHSATG